MSTLYGPLAKLTGNPNINTTRFSPSCLVGEQARFSVARYHHGAMGLEYIKANCRFEVAETLTVQGT